MRNVLDKFIEKIKAHIYVQKPLFKNCAVYEIMWKNVVDPDRPQMAIRRMRFA
jgi:hypothetical protein